MPFIFFIIISIIPQLAFAELSSINDADDSVDIGTIVVEDRAPDRKPSLDSTAAATVEVPREEADLSSSVADLIEQSAGAHVRRYGGLDDFSAISLRGSSSSEVQIYLDDMPLDASQGEPVDLSIIPIETIGRIEIYRGGSPGTMPDATAGGVVVLKTKDHPQKTETTIKNTGGSFLTYKGTISRSEPVGKFSYVAAFERFQSDGDFTYLDNKGTSFNSSDDQIVTRQNNYFSSNSLYTKVMCEPDSSTNLSFANLFFNKKQGIPGLGNRQSLNANLTTWRDMVFVTAGHNSEKITGLSGRANLFFDYLNNELYDPQGEIGLGDQDNNDNTYRFGGTINGDYDLGSHQTISAFLSGRAEFFLPKNYAANPQNGPQSRREMLNIGAQDEIKLFSNRLVIVPSLRLTNVFNDLTNEDPSIASATLTKNTQSSHQLSAKVGAELGLIGDLSIKGNFYRGFRNPTFSELFGDRGTIVGNPNLSPEESINFDLGLKFLRWREDEKLHVSLEAQYFRQSVDNLIQFVQTSQYTIKAENMNKARVQGAEISARASWRDRFQAYASFTYQNAKDVGSAPATSGKYLPGRPKNELSAGLTWSEKWYKWFSSKLFTELNYMSGNYLDTQNLLVANHRTLLSVGTSTIFVDCITLSFTVKNLLNDRIEDLVGFPLPGRSYWGTAELRI